MSSGACAKRIWIWLRGKPALSVCLDIIAAEEIGLVKKQAEVHGQESAEDAKVF